MESDGAVRAMVGGRDYSQSQFNRATDALRQPGSSFKPFVYLTALLNGFTPKSVVVDAPLCIKNWCPQNYGHSFSGPVDAHQRPDAVDQHHPDPAVPRHGQERRRRATNDHRRRPIAPASRRSSKESWALPIGVEAVNLTEMVGAYGVFASGGRKTPPHAEIEIRNTKGELIYAFDPAVESPRHRRPRRRSPR